MTFQEMTVSDSVSACVDGLFALDAIHDYALEILDFASGNSEIDARVAKILEVIDEARAALNLEKRP